MAKRQGVVTWSQQDILRVSAESTVCVRTIVRALSGSEVRPSSKTRIVSAARQLKLKLPAVLALLALGCGSSSQNPFGSQSFGGSGGAAGGAAGSAAGGIAGLAAGGSAGSQAGGAAGAGADGGGAAGQAGAAADGGEAGAPPACGGNAGGFMGCEFNGCNVCVEKVTGYSKYFANHPACTPLTTCLAGLYGACNNACPAPSEADK